MVSVARASLSIYVAVWDWDTELYERKQTNTKTSGVGCLAVGLEAP